MPTSVVVACYKSSRGKASFSRIYDNMILVNLAKCNTIHPNLNDVLILSGLQSVIGFMSSVILL